MPARKNQAPPAKFALRMTATLGKEAKESVAREGVSLNQFINLAVAEKVEYLENVAWIARRRPITQERLDKARALLHRGEVSRQPRATRSPRPTKPGNANRHVKADARPANRKKGRACPKACPSAANTRPNCHNIATNPPAANSVRLSAAHPRHHDYRRHAKPPRYVPQPRYGSPGLYSLVHPEPHCPGSG
jgi:hypothetical protein